jgi:hypothetical protein
MTFLKSAYKITYDKVGIRSYSLLVYFGPSPMRTRPLRMAPRENQADHWICLRRLSLQQQLY